MVGRKSRVNVYEADDEYDGAGAPLLGGLNGDPVSMSSLVPPTNSLESKPAKKPRLLSLDILRGFTMAVMILVNNGPQPPSTPSWWAHATWNGLHLADIVMPFFLFMVGMSAHLSASSLRARGWSRGRIALRIFIRSCKLFLFGLLCQGLRSSVYPWPYADLALLRIMGVLQRIAICNLIISLVFLFAPIIESSRSEEDYFAEQHPLDDVLSAYAPSRELSTRERIIHVVRRNAATWGIAVVFLSLYLALLYGVAVPDYESGGSIVACGGVRGDLSPACNSLDYIDRILLTPAHMYTPVSEPEGLASSISAVGSVFAGLYFGLVLSAFKDHKWRLVHWAGASVVMAAIGGIAAIGMPLNKTLYTTSYVLVTAGMCGAVFTFVYVLVDVFRLRAARVMLDPCKVLGMNAILIYMGDMIGWATISVVYYEKPEWNLYAVLKSAFVSPYYPEYVALHMWALTDLIMWTLIAYALFRFGIFFKV